MSLKPDGYLPRIIDRRLRALLKVFGGVEIVGCRWSGKTWTAMAQANSLVSLDEQRIRDIVALDPSLVLDGEDPRLIDEWQEAPRLWDAARREIDKAGNRRGMFILTGSSTPKKNSVVHSGVGRIARIRQRTMSLFESGESNGQVSLSGLFAGQFKKGQVQVDLKRIASLICRGGWPGALNVAEAEAISVPAYYLDTLFSSTASLYGKDEYAAQRLLKSLARNIGQATTLQTLADDTYADGTDGAGDADGAARAASTARVSAGPSAQTIDSYLGAFKDQFIIEEMGGWDAPVKARSRVRTKPKRTFADPSLVAALLSVTPDRLIGDMQVFGTLFEELCLRDLRIYAAPVGDLWTSPLMYYRDSDGLEVDAIIELRDGRWAAIEIKLNEDKIPDAVNSLLRLRSKVLSNPYAQNREPSFMAVIVGNGEFCRVTPEGVYVFPITALKD